jgi:alkylated DNA repair protein (DNA oxidative demethylase)
MTDLFAAVRPCDELAPGLRLARGFFDPDVQRRLIADIEAAARRAPWFTPRMPRTGKAFSVRMTNCGPLGWVSDVDGYRYQPRHPETGAPWPPIPALALAAWAELAACPQPPRACLVNFYAPAARMGLHQDSDEGDFSAPVVSISLGASALFRYGGTRRADPTKSIKLHSGDVVVLGGPSRLAFHGIDRIFSGSSDLLPAGRYNLTLRAVAGKAP